MTTGYKMHTWTAQKFYRAPYLRSSKLSCNPISVIHHFLTGFFEQTSEGITCLAYPFELGLSSLMINLAIYEMQVRRSCFGQWKRKYALLPNWVQISRSNFPNLHLRGHSHCRIRCILYCHILRISRALTLKLQSLCGLFTHVSELRGFWSYYLR